MFFINKEVRNDLHCAENLVIVDSEDCGIFIIIKAQPNKIFTVSAKFRAEAL